MWAILSDIHANYEALSAVVEAFKREEIDKYYCLGDTVGYGGSPNECADTVSVSEIGTSVKFGCRHSSSRRPA